MQPSHTLPTLPFPGGPGSLAASPDSLPIPVMPRKRSQGAAKHAAIKQRLRGSGPLQLFICWHWPQLLLCICGLARCSLAFPGRWSLPAHSAEAAVPLSTPRATAEVDFRSAPSIFCIVPLNAPFLFLASPSQLGNKAGAARAATRRRRPRRPPTLGQ